jgi:hypothetical protein
MANERKIRYQRQDINVTVANSTNNSFDFETDKTFEKVTGIQITTNASAALVGLFFNRGITINERLVFDDNFEPKMVFSGENTPSKERWYPLDEPAGGARVKGILTDAGITAPPYTITVWLRLENTKK